MTDERPTPEADAARVPAIEVSAWVEVVNVDLARRLERERDEARAALRELDEATSAAYPAFEAGADAQLAWSDRIDNARRCARSLLDEGAT